MKIMLDVLSKTLLDARINAVVSSDDTSERVKQAVAVYDVATVLKVLYDNCNYSVDTYRETAIDLVADFLGVETSTVLDKITRQLDININDFDHKLCESLNGNNAGLKGLYLAHVSSCKRHSGDPDLINAWV